MTDDPQPLPVGHPVREAWVARIAAPATRAHEYVDGRFVGWINPDLRAPAEPSPALSLPLVGMRPRVDGSAGSPRDEPGQSGG